ELENAIERAAILGRREIIAPEDLPPHVSAGLPPRPSPAPHRHTHRAHSAPEARAPRVSAALQLGPSPALPRQPTLAEAERVHILQTLERFGRNHSGAAEALGIGRTTLWRKLKEYGIDRWSGVSCRNVRFMYK